MELLLVDAAKGERQAHHRGHPYGFARQDRRDKPRVAIERSGANLLMAAGIDRLITMDCTQTRSRVF